MKTKTLIVMSLACIGLVGSASAVYANPTPPVLTFEGVGDLAQVNNYYNGGTDSQGNSGPNYGISFSSNGLGVVDNDDGGSGSFSNEPSPDTILAFVTGSGITMNVAAGFSNQLSFYYALFNNLIPQQGFISAFSGLDGTGKLLGITAVDDNSTYCPGGSAGYLCKWSMAKLTFDGTAKSVTFDGLANDFSLDDIAIGGSTSGTPTAVPEPGAFGIMIFGLALIGFAYRKRHSNPNRRAMSFRMDETVV